ncbi:MAG: Gfo/Idh/MocA family oxidoreductase [Clostridia bacterium]|nr:Gfo/Idh/MocA family oxidoreductase [Clostridia bacterium]MBR4442007.1 Gfo/Idh/MocA family oxidoreductase [Clostridia bacterium]
MGKNNADAVLSQFTQAIEEEAVDTSRKLKVGIIGTGWIAESHIQSYKNMPDVEIVAAADPIPGKAEAFMKRFDVEGVRFYPTHKEMIDNEKLDAVSVCTYNTAHCAPTVYALEHGINVLLEKPFSVTTEEAVEMMRAEKKSGKVLSIGFQPRGDENMQMIKKVVQSGALGEIYYIQTGGGRRRGIPNSTFIEKSTGGIGALGDIGCYSLDVVLNAIGYPKPLTVTGYKSDFFGKNPKYATPDRFHTAEENAARFSVDDFAAAFVRLEGGIILDFRISWAMHADTPGDTIIFGKEGALRIPSTDCWNGTFTSPMTLYHDLAGKQVETVIPLIPHKGPGLFDIKIRSFLDAIKYNRPAPVPTSEIIYNQAIIDHICKSAELGHEIEVVIPEI